MDCVSWLRECVCFRLSQQSIISQPLVNQAQSIVSLLSLQIQLTHARSRCVTSPPLSFTCAVQSEFSESLTSLFKIKTDETVKSNNRRRRRRRFRQVVILNERLRTSLHKSSSRQDAIDLECDITHGQRVKIALPVCLFAS